MDVFTCPYCGSTFHIGINWGTNIQNEIEPSLSVKSPILLNRDEPITKKSKILGLLLGLIAITLIGLLVLSTNSTNSPTKKIQSPPTMLVKLPETGKTNTSIAFNGWELFVNPELEVDSGNIGIHIRLTNWSSKNQLLRYQPNAFVLYLEDGTVFPQNTQACQPGDLFQNRQIGVKSRESLDIHSVKYWCNEEASIPMFLGTIPVNTERIYLKMNQLAEFKGLIIVFDL